MAKKQSKMVQKIEAKKSVHTRPSWDEYFMNIAELVGSRATCDRGRSGCVVVRDRRMLVTGYVGSPVGMAHCDELGHEMHTVINDDNSESKHCVRTVHAEQNAIAQAARMGIALDQATLYCHMTPCYICAKILINAGIKRIVALKDYHQAEKSKKLFKQSCVEFVLLNSETEKYEKM